MTPEQKQYYDGETARVNRGGSQHIAFVMDHIFNLGPLNPPVVAFGQDEDAYYTQYLRNWEEVEAMIANLRAEAIKAWGEKP